MSLESFKVFVKENPSLVTFVKNKEMTWQGFYELFDLYGSSNHIWDKYLGITSSGASSFKDMFSLFKNIDMNELQSGINSIQKGIGYVQDFISTRNNDKNKDKETVKDTYEPRPMYKYFDD